MKANIELNTSWLNGKYRNGEINTSIPYIAYNDFYVEGHDADNFIMEIHSIWVSGEMTTEQAFDKWANIYGL